METTYMYEVTFKHSLGQTWDQVRASSKEDAIQKIKNTYVDAEIISVSRVGN